MNKIEQQLNARLKQRCDDYSIRKLTSNFPSIDFCSNDYLGFARSETLKQSINHLLDTFPHYPNGAKGSRLLNGNTSFVEETEVFIANFHHAPSGLIFNSGYDANLGLLSCIPQRGDTIITDEYIHASLIDGCRLSHANRYKFLHNCTEDLEQKLKQAKGNIFVVVESVYSMDGDCAPLNQILSICKKYGANLIVDEAHAVGIFGHNGEGLVQQLGLQDDVFARVVTFGKALGTHGAIVLGSHSLRNYLINFARSFIYTTAAPIHAIASIKCAYQLLTKTDHTAIHQKIKRYNELMNENKMNAINSISCIQGIVFSSNEAAKTGALYLQNRGFDVRAILSPTIPKGKERLRICLHTYNTDDEILNLINQLKNI